ncbi:MAG: hypothetical protein AB7G08_26265 [Hyphomicrobiaceae bacterium]
MKAREQQHDQYGRLIEAKMRLMRKAAEVRDLPNLIAEEQRQREHARSLAETRRAVETVAAVHELHLAIARHEVEIAKTREQGVRAQRNLEAAQRVKDAEIDSWYQAAAARANNATAEYQDTLADLQRGQTAPDPGATASAAANQRAADLAVLDHEIELERQRGNQAAVFALTNLRARLQGSS